MLAKDVGEYVLAPGVFPPIEGMTRPRSSPSANVGRRNQEVGRRVQEDLRRQITLGSAQRQPPGRRKRAVGAAPSTREPLVSRSP